MKVENLEDLSLKKRALGLIKGDDVVGADRVADKKRRYLLQNLG